MSATLLPYQQRWIDDDSPVKVWDADRQIGTTFAALHEVAERLLSSRVDGDMCQALWIGDSDRSVSEARREFQGLDSQVTWSTIPGWNVGPSGIVVVDNVKPRADLCRYLNDLMSHGVRVQIVMSGQPGYASAWAHVLRSLAISFHRTTIMDAVREGLGQRIADTRDEQWTYAWEFRWLAGIADLMEDQVDCPRFHGADS